MSVNIFFVECILVTQAVFSEPTNNTGDFKEMQQTKNVEFYISSMQIKQLENKY